MIHMEYYLVVSTIMMFAGIYGFFTRRNTLAILISVELMLNATDINFAVFNRFLFPEGMDADKRAALRREAALKKLSKPEKEVLCAAWQIGRAHV